MHDMCLVLFDLLPPYMYAIDQARRACLYCMLVVYVVFDV
jgi:hypothetical protein